LKSKANNSQETIDIFVAKRQHGALRLCRLKELTVYARRLATGIESVGPGNFLLLSVSDSKYLTRLFKLTFKTQQFVKIQVTKRQQPVLKVA
jgi:hypothetical protein